MPLVYSSSPKAGEQRTLRLAMCLSPASPLEVTFPFLQFHRAILVVIDGPVFPFRPTKLAQFSDDFAYGIGIRLDRPGTGRAPQRSQPATFLHWLLAGTEW